MNYRRKNLPSRKPSVLASSSINIEGSLLNPDFLRKLDFFGTFKKELNHQQTLMNIIPERELAIASSCFSKITDNQIKTIIKRAAKQHPDLLNINIFLSDEMIRDRIFKALTQNVSKEDTNKIELLRKKCNMLNTEELKEIFIQRLAKMFKPYLRERQLVQNQENSKLILKSAHSMFSKNPSRRKFEDSQQRTVENQHYPRTQERLIEGKKPTKKISTDMLLKQSTATTQDPYAQFQSKQTTPRSGRKIMNNGTIISKSSNHEEEGKTPVNNPQLDNHNFTTVAHKTARKMSFQNSLRQRSQNKLRNVTPIRTGAEIRIKSKEEILAKQKTQQNTTQNIMRNVETLFTDSEISTNPFNQMDQILNKNKEEPNFKLQISLDGTTEFNTFEYKLNENPNMLSPNPQQSTQETKNDTFHSPFVLRMIELDSQDPIQTPFLGKMHSEPLHFESQSKQSSPQALDEPIFSTSEQKQVEYYF